MTKIYYLAVEEAVKIAESLIWSIVTKVLDRLRDDKPKKFAAFPSGKPAAEE